jgi:ferredoxin
MRLTVDHNLCRGHARCIEVTPDAFVWDEETDQASAAPGADGLAPEHLEAAVRACPERAITLAQ